VRRIGRRYPLHGYDALRPPHLAAFFTSPLPPQILQRAG
jgi:hypothetical protein